MVTAFRAGCSYEFDGPSCLYLEVLAVRHKNAERWKLKVQYRHKSTGKLQWIGKQNYHEEVRIPSHLLQHWKIIRGPHLPG